MLQKKNILLMILLSIFSLGHSQEKTILNIWVKSSLPPSKESIEISIEGINGFNSKSTIKTTDVFSKKIEFGKYKVKFSNSTLNNSFEINIVPNDLTEYIFDLDEKSLKKPITPTEELNEIVIISADKDLKLNEKAVNSTIINIKKEKAKATSIRDIVGLSSGVKIRQDGGGLGSKSDIHINGFSSKSIRKFKDEIPIEFYGNSVMSFSPTEFYDNVSLFKGSVPNYIDLDAIGGAVNFSTNTDLHRFATLSYEIGSYNTHKIVFRGLYDIDNTYLGINMSQALSQNNYKVTVDDFQNNSKERIALFNNNFNSNFSEIYFGIKENKYSDYFRISYLYYDNTKHIPYSSNMTTPYGKVKNDNNSDFIGSLRYKKKISKFNIDEFIGYNTYRNSFVDTIKGKYDWRGNFSPKYHIGEVINGGSIAKKRYLSLMNRLDLKYEISESHSINFNSLFFSTSRTGSDELAPKSSGDGITDPTSYPIYYKRFYNSLNVNSQFFDRKLESDFVVRFYNIYLKGNEVEQMTGVLSDRQTKKHKSQWSFQESLKYMFNQNSLVKISLNYSSRMPDQEEVFGDGAMIFSNPTLEPERSINTYVNYQYNYAKKIKIDLNLWYRTTKDIILKEIINDYMIYNNIGNVDGYGFDFETTYKPMSNLFFMGNISFHETRMKDLPIRYGLGLYNARLKNTPFLFSNLGVNYKLEKILTKNSDLSVYWNLSWVNEFYSNFIPVELEKKGFAGHFFGELKYNNNVSKVPYQIFNTGGLVWSYNDLLSIAVEVKNIFNTKAYDNYNIENMGRYISSKIMLTIK